MSLDNINYSSKLVNNLVDTKAFIDRPLMIIDGGARWNFEQHWLQYVDQATIIGFEPEKQESLRLLRELSDEKHRIYPIGLDHKKGKKTFYVTQWPSGSSFYPVNAALWDRFIRGDDKRIVGTVEMETIALDSFVEGNELGYVDYVKLDTEGSELDILKGAVMTLNQSIMAVSVEVEFIQMHNGQPFFADVDAFLRERGFHLYDLSLYRIERKALPMLSSSVAPENADYGQLTIGQTLYLRDAVAEIESGDNLLGDGWSTTNILKLASIMDVFCLPDCAIELLLFARERGLLEGFDVEKLVNTMVPKIGNKTVTYGEYLEHIDAIKKRGYTDNFERSRRTALRFMPDTARKVMGKLLVGTRDSIDRLLKG